MRTMKTKTGGERMLFLDGYSIDYDERKNKITIVLPQTKKTITSTEGEIVDRKIDVPPDDLMMLLTLTQLIFQK